MGTGFGFVLSRFKPILSRFCCGWYSYTIKPQKRLKMRFRGIVDDSVSYGVVCS